MSDDKSDFEREAEGEQVGLVTEFVHLLMHTKKWWLAPIIIVLLLVGGLALLGGSTAAPFIYTLF